MVPKWFTPIVVAAVAGVSVWLLSEQAPKKPRLIALDNSVPDTYIEDFTTHIMDEHGNPRHEIRASYMAHFTFDDHSELTSPQVIFYRPDKSRWTLSSESGVIKNDVDEITLEGKVTIIHQLFNEKTSELEINTSNLVIRPDDSYAETDQLITITSGDYRVQSNGIRAYINDGRVELLSRVKGEYGL